MKLSIHCYSNVHNLTTLNPTTITTIPICQYNIILLLSERRFILAYICSSLTFPCDVDIDDQWEIVNLWLWKLTRCTICELHQRKIMVETNFIKNKKKSSYFLKFLERERNQRKKSYILLTPNIPIQFRIKNVVGNRPC